MLTGQQLTEATGVIVVRMRDEDIVNVADADTSPLQTARDPGARIHDVERAIYNQEI